MNRKRAKELQPIFNHFADGGDVEARYIGIDGELTEWQISKEPAFAGCCEYRIKPTPREWWLSLLNGYSVVSDIPCPFPAHDWIKVREVLDDD